MLNFKTLQKLSKNFSLLYVEDDDILREKTAVIFKNLFLHVETAVDGTSALESYKNYYTSNQQHYDIVITDIQMPRLDGICLTKEIFKINKEQKVIIISAYNDKDHLIDLINIGVEAFMQKPLSSQEILTTLNSVCTELKGESVLLLGEGYSYNSSSLTLFLHNERVELSEKELNLLDLLVTNKNQSFSCIDIFNHLYINEPEKEFSNDSIKSLIKRLRKKTPNELIFNTQQIGYSANY